MIRFFMGIAAASALCACATPGSGRLAEYPSAFDRQYTAVEVDGYKYDVTPHPSDDALKIERSAADTAGNLALFVLTLGNLDLDHAQDVPEAALRQVVTAYLDDDDCAITYIDKYETGTWEAGYACN